MQRTAHHNQPEASATAAEGRTTRSQRPNISDSNANANPDERVLRTRAISHSDTPASARQGNHKAAANKAHLRRAVQRQKAQTQTTKTARNTSIVPGKVKPRRPDGRTTRHQKGPHPALAGTSTEPTQWYVTGAVDVVPVSRRSKRARGEDNSLRELEIRKRPRHRLAEGAAGVKREAAAPDVNRPVGFACFENWITEVCKVKGRRGGGGSCLCASICIVYMAVYVYGYKAVKHVLGNAGME